MSLQRPFDLDEEVWLTPRTLWAPAVAYKQPHGRIVAKGNVRVTVALDDGETVEIHVDNVTRTPPGQAKARKAAGKSQKPAAPECDGTAACPLHTTARAAHARHEQVSLW